MSSKVEVVAVTPLYQEPHIFRLVAESWKKVRGVDRWIAFNDHSPPETVEIAREFMEVVESGEPQKSNYVRDGGDTHVWDVKTMDRMARIRNRILFDHQGVLSLDAVLMVDSDILLAPGVVEEYVKVRGWFEQQWELRCPLAISPIFWSKWKTDGPLLPQVWDYNPYGFKGVVGERLEQLKTPGVYRVMGLGAITFFDSGLLYGIEDEVSYTPIESLRRIGGMGQGEDRWFSIRAECAGHNLYGMATDPPLAYHIYRDEDLKGIAVWEEMVRRGVRTGEVEWEKEGED